VGRHPVARYIAWYTVELERHLERHVAPSQLLGLVQESEDHLLERKEELEAQGVDSVRAQRIAVEEFGSPRAIANATLDARTSGRWRGVSQWFMPIGLVLSLLAVSVAYTSPRGASPLGDIEVLAVVLLSLAVGAVLSFLARRHSLPFIAAAGFLCMGILFGFLQIFTVPGIGGMPVERRMVPQLLLEMDRQLAQARSDLDLLATGRRIFMGNATEEGDALASKLFGSEGGPEGYLIPLPSGHVPNGILWSRVADWSAAMNHWRSSGLVYSYEHHVRRIGRERDQLMASVQDPGRTYPGFALAHAIVLGGGVSAVWATVNLTFALMGRQLNRKRRRRTALA
jgi:hypothetical protein